MLHLRNYRLTALVLLCGVLLLSLFLLASGCTRGEKTPPAAAGTITDPEQQGIVEAWEGTRHADTYILGTDGLNNKCARCHSPFNWKPTDKADLPATCQSCIIPFSLSEPTEPVLEEEWNTVKCNVCHAVEKFGDKGTADGGGTATSLTDATQDFLTTVVVGMTAFNQTDNSHATVTAVVNDGSITTTELLGREGETDSDNTWESGDKYHLYYEGAASQVSFLDMRSTQPGVVDEEFGQQILKYASVSTNTELCEKCHMDRDTFLYGRALDPAHAGNQCTDCHDAHSLERSCDDCHTEPVTGTVHE